ncbi:hypothetical protein BLOT_000329 [Blomia tropicalis]|nr:hypothetical protein BLOT_000329 [Blomia tropicalis]
MFRLSEVYKYKSKHWISTISKKPKPYFMEIDINVKQNTRVSLQIIIYSNVGLKLDNIKDVLTSKC